MIIGNIFYSIICGWYLKISDKDYSKTKSIIFPLIFNFLGFAYTITKISNAKNRLPNWYNSDVDNEAPLTDEPNEESDEIPLENQLKKNEKITVNLENWLGTVSFKTTREKLYQLKGYFEEEFNDDNVVPSWDELRINNEFIIDGNIGATGCCDPYLIFEPKGQFLVIDRWEISGESDGTHSGDGYSFEFINCKAPAKLEKYLFNEWMFFSVSNRALTKAHDLKTMKIIYKDTNDAYVSNDGSATIRLQDFDIDKFFDDREIKAAEKVEKAVIKKTYLKKLKLFRVIVNTWYIFDKDEAYIEFVIQPFDFTDAEFGKDYIFGETSEEFLEWIKKKSNNQGAPIFEILEEEFSVYQANYLLEKMFDEVKKELVVPFEDEKDEWILDNEIDEAYFTSYEDAKQYLIENYPDFNFDA